MPYGTVEMWVLVCSSCTTRSRPAFSQWVAKKEAEDSGWLVDEKTRQMLCGGCVARRCDGQGSGGSRPAGTTQGGVLTA